jgi:formate hydrogenlyase transcriptional activator
MASTAPSNSDHHQARAALSKWNAELAYRSVVEATADQAGLEFMRQRVKSLALSLNVRYSFVAEFNGSEERVRTIAFWSGDDWRPNVEYRLAGTPCESVIAGKFCLYKDDVQRMFPYDSDLLTLGARSYLGVPLRGAQGQVLGHLAALDTEPMPDSPRDLALFEVFANRARVEMERAHAEQVMQRACRELEGRLEIATKQLVEKQHGLELAYGELQALLEINQSSMRHLRRADLFAELARCVKPLLRCERFGIEVPTGPETLRVHVLAMDQPSQGPMIEEFRSAGTVCRWAQEVRQRFVGSCREELRARFPTTVTVMEREGMESLVALPLVRGDRSFGALFFMSTEIGAYRSIPAELLDRVASAVAVAVDNCFAHEQLAERRDKLAAENVYLQEEIRATHDFREIVGNSPAILRTLSLIDEVARTPATVLVLGETGTGKELVARAIHAHSDRRDRPLVKVNCSAISAGLVESELFGHVRGAFTGAVTGRVGRFELAHGGTIFLDEIGELPLETQVKLLRVLQEREIEPVGSSHSKKVDVRVIAATHRDLAAEVEAGRFRSDLFYRLNVFPLVLPPLRERREDIELLASFFAGRHGREIGKRIDGLSPTSVAKLVQYDWPGNIRELSNLIERAVVLTRSPILEVDPGVTSPSTKRVESPTERSSTSSLVELQRRHILEVLAQTHWVVEGEAGAASRLGINPSTLRSRMKRLGIARGAD